MGVGMAARLRRPVRRVPAPRRCPARLDPRRRTSCRNGATDAGSVVMLDYKEPSLAFYQGGTIREESAMTLSHELLDRAPPWLGRSPTRSGRRHRRRTCATGVSRSSAPSRRRSRTPTAGGRVDGAIGRCVGRDVPRLRAVGILPLPMSEPEEDPGRPAELGRRRRDGDADAAGDPRAVPAGAHQLPDAAVREAALHRHALGRPAHHLPHRQDQARRPARGSSSTSPRACARGQFDLAVLLPNSFKTALVCKMAGIHAHRRLRARRPRVPAHRQAAAGRRTRASSSRRRS